MSFVNLMAGARWSEQDIVSRMEALIRERCSATEEMILHRKMLGASIGAYDLTPEEQQEIAAYAAVCAQAQTAGREARADAALLSRVLDAESGAAELAPDDAEGQALLAARAAARPPVEEPGNEGNNDAQEGSLPADGVATGA